MMARFKNGIRMFLFGLMGTAFGSGTCQDVARVFNPCFGAGDVFTEGVCTAADFEDIFDGFAPNFERDPFCSLPQTCPGTGTFDPSAGDGEIGEPVAVGP